MQTPNSATEQHNYAQGGQPEDEELFSASLSDDLGDGFDVYDDDLDDVGVGSPDNDDDSELGDEPDDEDDLEDIAADADNDGEGSQEDPAEIYSAEAFGSGSFDAQDFGPTRTDKQKPAWDKQKTRRLFERYKRYGDKLAREKLINNHMNLVRFLAAKFRNRGESYEDLISVGTIGLIKAIDRFEPERGLEFTTYATPTILGEIKRHFRDKGWSVRVPRRLQELSQKVNQATDTLTATLNRSPSPREVAAALGVSVDEVLEAIESSAAYTTTPLEASAGNDEDGVSVIDRYASYDEALGSVVDRLALHDALRELSDREREIINMRFTEGLTQSEIAEKLGVSQVQVSRMLRKILAHLREIIDA